MAREVVSIESRIEQVTVYASGARIRRVGILRGPLPAGVRFVGLPLAVIDDTVRTEVEGPAIVAAVRAGVETVAGEPRTEESAELRGARRRLALAEAEVDRVRDALERLATAPVVEADPSEEPPAAWSAVLGARRSLVSLRAARELALREQLTAARRELDETRRVLEVVVERDQRAGTARAARLHEVRKHVDLDLVAQPGTGEVTVRLEYQVAAARWAPSYVARLDGEQAKPEMERASERWRVGFELRAVIAQNSGEDWTGVALRLSTAEPERFAQLPELHAQKIGRRQQEPARRGFRAPPTGADALYADYDHGYPRRSLPISATTVFDDSMYEGRAPAPPPAPELAKNQVFGGLSGEVWDEDSSRSKDMYPVMSPMSVVAPASKSRGGGGIAGAVAGVIAAPFALAAQAVTSRSGAPPPRREAAAPQPPTPRLDYGNLRMATASAAERGKLIAAPAQGDREYSLRVDRAVYAIEQLVLPPGHVGDWVHTYDYAFASDGMVDVKSDGAWHSIALTARAGTASVRHVAVPREQSDVFRVAAISNPFEGPLLPGPIDIYDRGQFLVTSEVDYTPPGGTVDVGLGVDPAVKIARNVEFHEEAAGMLRGVLKLVHAITIDVENLSQRPIDLEVRERVPVTREGDDDIEVAVGKADPPWERWTPDTDAPRDARLRGGFRWKLAIPATSKKLLRAGYEVKIAGKLELIGGNRREP